MLSSCCSYALNYNLNIFNDFIAFIMTISYFHVLLNGDFDFETSDPALEREDVKEGLTLVEAISQAKDTTVYFDGDRKVPARLLGKLAPANSSLVQETAAWHFYGVGVRFGADTHEIVT